MLTSWLGIKTSNEMSTSSTTSNMDEIEKERGKKNTKHAWTGPQKKIAEYQTVLDERARIEDKEDKEKSKKSKKGVPKLKLVPPDDNWDEPPPLSEDRGGTQQIFPGEMYLRRGFGHQSHQAIRSAVQQGHYRTPDQALMKKDESAYCMKCELPTGWKDWIAEVADEIKKKKRMVFKEHTIESLSEALKEYRKRVEQSLIAENKAAEKEATGKRNETAMDSTEGPREPPKKKSREDLASDPIPSTSGVSGGTRGLPV